VVIIVHGGGWMTGDREKDIVSVFAPYATNYTWFTIYYRLAPTNRWPACIDDVNTAIRWVKQHAAEYRVIRTYRPARLLGGRASRDLRWDPDQRGDPSAGCPPLSRRRPTLFLTISAAAA